MKTVTDFADHAARVLIVDDECANRQLLEVMLKPEGFVLRTANNGGDALAIIAQDPPDLVLLDIMMPGMDGYEVATRIKADVATNNIPVIIVTALDDRDARMHALSAGAEDFLTKPIDRAELCMRVRNLLRLKAYGDRHDKYCQILEGEVRLRTTDLRIERDRAQRYLGDVDNLLTVILGLAELVKAEGDSADQPSADLSEIIKGAQRALAVTRQLLVLR